MMTEAKSGSESLGKERAWPYVLIIIAFVVQVFVLFYWMQRPRPNPPVCGTNISGLVKSLVVYANDDKFTRMPPGDKWCDLLVGRDYTSPKQHVCPVSGAVVGESSYAINANLAGKDVSKVSPDTVLLFETKFVAGSSKRDTKINEREFWKTMPYHNPNTKVYKGRWNQSGGPEILTVENHGGEGCNVAFVDTHVKWIRKEDISKLKWNPD
jgi:prepilin-type processing-associated H-X9-DG protein